MQLVTFLLSTHLNAALAGFPVRFGPEESEACRRLLWNAKNEVEWRLPGPQEEDGPLTSVDDWFETLRAKGARRAWFARGWDRSTGGDGIVVQEKDADRFYRATYKKRTPESPHKIGFQAIRLQERAAVPRLDVETAAQELVRATVPMLAFARRHEAIAFSFAFALDKALAYARLVGAGAPSEAVDERIGPLFPAGVYPVDHRLLMAAALNSAILGGIGSWNDLGPPSDDRAEYEGITREFARAHEPVYGIASALDLSIGKADPA